jgi:hypothetical protein
MGIQLLHPHDPDTTCKHKGHFTCGCGQEIIGSRYVVAEHLRHCNGGDFHSAGPDRLDNPLVCTCGFKAFGGPGSLAAHRAACHDSDEERPGHLDGIEAQRDALSGLELEGGNFHGVPTPSSVPEDVRFGEFGCGNCLYASVECWHGSKYGPASAQGQPSCKSYVYFD